MTLNSKPADTLKDPEVRRYFLEILESGLSSEEKYDKLIQFFKLEGKVEAQVLSYGSQLLTSDNDALEGIFAEVGQKIGNWNPNEILQKSESSIKKAFRRLKISQHRDGGWGRMPEQSISWDTAYAVLCFHAAVQHRQFALDSDGGSFKESFRGGIDWLKRRYSDWATDRNRNFSVYEVALGVRSFYRIGEEPFPAIPRFVDKLVESQNEDGGWDASIWGADHEGPAMVFSEVGATSAALRAIAEVGNTNLRATTQEGIRWLIDNQNDDGSWNNGSREPDREGVQGTPSINKTCDGVKGLSIGASLDLSEDVKERISKAVEWILDQEKPILDRDLKITGWGWINSEELSDLENTALTLETLVGIENVSPLLLTANAQWLLKKQYRAEGSAEDGAWEFGHTSRVALSLVEFYKRIEKSSLFGVNDYEG